MPPHSMRSVAPAGVSSIEIVIVSTGALVLPAAIGVRPISRSLLVGNAPLTGLLELAEDQLPALVAGLAC